MSATVHYTCDTCNPTGRLDVDYGHDAVTIASGLVVPSLPEGWWEIPGAGRSQDGSSGHACPRCLRERPEVKEQIGRARSEMLEEVLARNPPLDDDFPGQVPSAEDLERAADEVFGRTEVEE